MIQLKDPNFWDLSAKNIRFERIQNLDHRFETKKNHQLKKRTHGLKNATLVSKNEVSLAGVGSGSYKKWNSLLDEEPCSAIN
jgi:hypothetical protein